MDIRRALAGAEYPATAEELFAVAEENGADDDVLEALQALDEDVEYESAKDVAAALAESEEELEDLEDE